MWVSRVEFLEQLAAISSAFRSEVAKKTEEGKSVGQLLWQAGQPDRLEYLFNNLRVRSAMSAAENLLLPTGTTSNESLHAEINGWFRQTQRLHRSTLKLKLDILTLSKLLSHNARTLFTYCPADPFKPCLGQKARGWPVDTGTVGSMGRH